MTPEQFCYWMQGFCELTGNEPTKEQWDSIVEHLQLVFNKQTRVFGPAIASPALGPLQVPFDSSRIIC